jgi:peptidoglycan/xylan/chitin deacetylase (PgdA/CDA1 family)
MNQPVEPTISTLAVLMYHSVSHVDHGPLQSLAVPPELLRDQLSTLSNAGYRLLGLSEALDLVYSGTSEAIVALTFDDGYADFLYRGVGVLTELGASATLYMSAGHLGQPASWLGQYARDFGPLLTLTQLIEVADAGIEVGNHGLVHQPLDVLSPVQLDGEVRQSRDRLADAVGRPIRSFCYPHGYHGPRVRAAVARLGHDNACEVGRRLYRRGDDRLAIPRLQPTPGHSGADLLRLVRTGGNQLIPQAKRLAQPGWRLTRRISHRVFDKRLT